MLSENITVCIFAWNEALRLERCIRNFKGLFRILVVDNGSTDGTPSKALGFGCEVIVVKNPGFIETPEVMNPVWAACATDYILIASVSEFVPLDLLRKYADVANSKSHDVVRAYRESITAGLPIPISGRPSRRFPGELRFFRRGSVDYAGNQVHDRGNVSASQDRILNLVCKPNYHFFQFRDYDCGQTERKHAAYNDVLAKQRFEAGSRFSWSIALYQSTKQFLNAYFRFGSWRHGMLGFVHSYYRAHMEFGVWLRIWEWQHGYSREGVLQANDKARRLLEERIENFQVSQTNAAPVSHGFVP